MKPVLILPVEGVRIGVAATGSRYKDRLDLALFEIAPDSSFCCFYTKNKFAAAPVELARENQEKTNPRYLIVNSGNANAGTGKEGLLSARRICQSVALQARCQVEEVLPFSTGVIGEPLDSAIIEGHVPFTFSGLKENGWIDAAKAIMTTDTFPKVRSIKIDTGKESVVVTGVCKGSGMIKPNMATMLAYVATDAHLSKEVLSSIGKEALDLSFNRITVDGETSTNDAFALIATGKATQSPIDSIQGPEYQAISDAIIELCERLAKDIVRDGEGATKLVTVNVIGAKTVEDALKVAYSVGESSLVKTALFAEDPNWGRILSAVGASDAVYLEIEKVAISIDEHQIVSNGGIHDSYDERSVADVMRETEFEILIDLNIGGAKGVIWTCDLSYEYVKINSEYRS